MSETSIEFPVPMELMNINFTQKLREASYAHGRLICLLKNANEACFVSQHCSAPAELVIVLFVGTTL